MGKWEKLSVLPEQWWARARAANKGGPVRRCVRDCDGWVRGALPGPEQETFSLQNSSLRMPSKTIPKSCPVRGNQQLALII